jgi:hypothetical protein
MQDTRTTASVESIRRIAVRRRAKRGLVAGYIHELARHGSPAAPRKPAEPAPKPAHDMTLSGALVTEEGTPARV